MEFFLSRLKAEPGWFFSLSFELLRFLSPAGLIIFQAEFFGLNLSDYCWM